MFSTKSGRSAFAVMPLIAKTPRSVRTRHMSLDRPPRTRPESKTAPSPNLSQTARRSMARSWSPCRLRATELGRDAEPM